MAAAWLPLWVLLAGCASVQQPAEPPAPASLPAGPPPSRPAAPEPTGQPHTGIRVELERDINILKVIVARENGGGEVARYAGRVGRFWPRLIVLEPGRYRVSVADTFERLYTLEHVPVAAGQVVSLLFTGEQVVLVGVEPGG